MIVLCELNEPFKNNLGIPDNFDFGLKVGKEYIVMGVLTFRKSNDFYFLVDENGLPSWFPYQLFKIKDNSLPQDWFLRINKNNKNADFFNLVGFKELVNDETFFNKLLERDSDALEIYFKRKIELEHNLNKCKF